jgi:hypothetical protein
MNALKIAFLLRNLPIGIPAELSRLPVVAPHERISRVLERINMTAPLRALFADALGRISKTPMGASLSNCLGGVLGGPTASPPPRSPPKPAKAAPTPAKAAHPKSPELLEVFGPEELYPLTDAMEKALKEQQL